LSDGNLEFGVATDLTVTQPDYFIGMRLKRFSIVADDCVVECVSVEDSILNVTCSSAEALR
jgi:peroxiredoxin